MSCSGAYFGARYYVYRLIARDGAVAVRFRDVRLSIFPLGLEVRGLRDLPIRGRNLVSFDRVNVYLPPASLFMRRKAVSLEIEKPVFVLDDSLLRARSGSGGLGSSFAVQRVRVRDGEMHFTGRDLQARLLHVNLQSGSLSREFSFRVDSPHLSVTLPVSGEPVTLRGGMSAEVHQQGDAWKISRFAWQTSDLRVAAYGRLLPRGAWQFNASLQGDLQNVLRPVLDELTVLGLTYADARLSRDTQRLVRVSADFTSPACRVKGSRLAALSGQARWDSGGRTLELEASFASGLARSSLRLASRARETRIGFQDLPAAAIADILDITQDAPLAGLVRRGEVEFVPGFIRGSAELDEAPSRRLADSPFVVRGRIEFQRDKQAHLTTFAGEALQTSAGEVSLRGRIDTRARDSDIRIAAAVRGCENITPYVRHYLDIDLRPWKLGGGGGDLELAITRRAGRKRIDGRFRLGGFTANRQPVSSLAGEVHHAPPGTGGAFTVSGPGLASRIELAIVPGQTTFRFPDLRGEARVITRVLGLDLALAGALAGDVTYRAGKAMAEPEASGRIAAQRLTFMGLGLERVQGELRTHLHDIELTGLEFDSGGGHARGDVRIDFSRRRFDLQGRVAGLDAARLVDGFRGRVDLEIGGAGDFMKDPLRLAVRGRDLEYYPERGFTLDASGSLLTDFSGFRLNLAGEAAHDSGPSPFSVELARGQGRYSGSFRLDLRNLDLLIPWRNNVGAMRLLGQFLTAPGGGVSSRGVAVLSGSTLSLPNFSHSLDDFQGTVTFSGSDFILQSLRGRMGGGPVEGSGQLSLAGGGLRRLSFSLQGKGLRLYPMDRVSCLVNPDLTLRYEDRRLTLAGALNFQSVDWQREIDERIVFNTRSQLSTAESKILEMLRLDIAMTTEDILLRNSLGRIRGRFKLRLGGTASFPILSGACEGSQGEIFFSDRSFNLLKARLVFNNKTAIDPLIHVESEAFVQSYRIRFDINGSASRAKPSLTASPPLPFQDIIALVSLGEMFQRTGSSEISSRDSSTALVTTKLTEDIKNRANKLLGINLLRIDPVFSDQSTVNSSRLTIGTTFAKDVVVVYSTDLSATRQQIVYLQYQLSPSISLIAMRNQEGRYSLDLRLRSRR
ncbi:MAG TPA: translocation/assembly module TamB domain-containing protein [Candidatus Aminicenantes bacterium]|nr:translocation/assembly module TamB domain-containing protein [Candidatus Aminicenantes bacterium]